MPDQPPILFWRAAGGYQGLPMPQAPPAMYCAPPPWLCQPYPGCPPPGYQYPVCFGPMPPPPFGNLSPPPLPAGKNQPAKEEAAKPAKEEEEAKKANDKTEAPAEENKEVAKKENPYAPPRLLKGVNYMFDSQHTILHIFSKAAPVWTEKYAKQTLRFKIFKVSINFTVKMVAEHVLRKSGQDCTGWAVTEIIERGSGGWDKGSTIPYDSDKSKGTLKSMGWSSKRGNSLPPVWLVVHKADAK